MKTSKLLFYFKSLLMIALLILFQIDIMLGWYLFSSFTFCLILWAYLMEIIQVNALREILDETRNIIDRLIKIEKDKL